MKIAVAPIAGYNDPPFRLLLSCLSYDLIFSEMIATKGVTYRNRQTLAMLNNHGEKRLAVQAFGNDPVDFINTAQVILANRLSNHMDINAGCSIKKIVRSDFGVRLMVQPDAVRRIVFSLKEKFPDLTITLKTRLGLTVGDGLLERFLDKIYDIPLSFITIHGRYASQIFSGAANWSSIDRIARNSPFPVYGNGDIFCYRDYVEREKYMGYLRGVMLGRGVLKNPFLIEEIRSRNHDESGKCGAFQIRKLDFLKELLESRKCIFGETYALKETRKYYGWLLKGFKDASFYRNHFIQEEKYVNIIRTINKLKESIID